VPVLSLKYSRGSCIPYLIVILNFILPGTGTILASCLTHDKVINCWAIWIGYLQFITALLLIGFIWSWWWAIRIIHKTDNFHRQAIVCRTLLREELER